MKRLVLLLLFSSTLPACAGIDVEPVDETDGSSSGLRFNRPAPYLMISGDKAEIVWLPDRDETYAVKWSTGLFGTVDPEVTLEDGWNLTALKGAIDSGTAKGLEAVAGAVKSQGIAPPAKTDVLLAALRWDAAEKIWKVGDAKRVSLEGVKP